MSKESLALVNALLNAASGVLLVLGYLAIRRNPQAPATHARRMTSAVAVSAVFLVTYVTSYVLFGERSSGLSPGPLKTLYLLLLFSHILLAVLLLPMVAMVLYRALRGEFQKHRRLARWTFPVWVYVSATGVLVYLMLYQLFPRLG